MVAKTFIAFGDVHIPYQDRRALGVIERAIEHIKPDLLVCLGDLLDCSSFSRFNPLPDERKTDYEADLAAANLFLSRVAQHTKKLVFIEGNHEYRIRRFAAETKEGASILSMLSPQKHLNCIHTYIPYGPNGVKLSYYAINQRLIATHGWTHGKNAARAHLQMAQGKSIIFGHTHISSSIAVQDVYNPARIIEARGCGCLCGLVPLYACGRPVDWSHSFILGFLGQRSDTLYTVPILSNRCILPDGTEVLHDR
jgi:predicted phosphodiesterase